MRNFKIILFLLTCVVGFYSIFPGLARAQYFGQNKVNYSYFTWKYLTTEHFDIYYNQDGLAIAEFAAEIAEEAYSELAQNLDYYPENPDPIIIITYQSHNDFEQTNLAGSSPSESTGGFTEFLKNRVVVPFEGDHEKFRHVLHHELTHAVYLNLLFGQGLGAIVSGISQARIPLWFTEGLSEYQSRNGLDLETEMILRDAVINDNLPEIQYLDMMGYVGVYKMGQSVLYWIAHRYGDQKVGEILQHLRGLKDFDRSLKAAIGIDQKELTKRWRRWIKERYWPQVVKMAEPQHLAQQMTNHKKEFCFINNSPAISPNGEWIAFLSDRSDYFDLYLMSTLDGKVHRRLIRGQRTGEFEELHWLRPGISWASDGKRIAFCAKAGGEDALYIIDVSNGKVLQKLLFGTDGLFSPSWSPIADKVALVRSQNGRSDLALVDLSTEQLSLVTDDLFDEADPSWSPDGKRLLFTSNRHDVAIGTDHTEQTLSGFDYQQFDIYDLDLETSELTRLTDDPSVERSPLWTPLEQTILYTSNLSGTYNLYLHDIPTGELTAITNNVTGAQQPTISKHTRAVVFSSYFDNGWDIFQLNDPFDTDAVQEPFDSPPPEIIPKTESKTQLASGRRSFKHFVFDRAWNEADRVKDPIDSTETQAEDRTKGENGSYPSKDYKVQLSPDVVFINAAYSPYYAMQGSGLILFTDVLGNHNLYLSLDLYQSFEWSNIFLNYEYLARRLTYSVGSYHYAYLYYGSYQDAPVYWQDRNMGLFLTSSYPLNRFKRVELGFNFFQIMRKPYDWASQDKPPSSERLTIMPAIGLVHDTSIWRSALEPSNGSRWRVDLTGSPAVFGNDSKSLEFLTISGDWRNYFNHKKTYSLAVRFSGALSQGKNPQHFFLGGVQNWFNPRLDSDNDQVLVNSIEDIYFASFVTPLRGVGFYNQIGTRYLLTNLEFRFPFIKHLVLGWPLPAYFYNVRGALFADIGSAWEPEDLDGTWYPEQWSRGYGFGLRLDLGIFPLEWDVAWSPDSESGLRPHYYFSINAGF